MPSALSSKDSRCYIINILSARGPVTDNLGTNVPGEFVDEPIKCSNTLAIAWGTPVVMILLLESLLRVHHLLAWSGNLRLKVHLK